MKADVNLAGDAKTNTTANTGFVARIPTCPLGNPARLPVFVRLTTSGWWESTLTDGAALIEELKATLGGLRDSEHPALGL